MSAKRWCDFFHKSMRTRSIFDIIDYLNRAHFAFQKESSFVCFTYWMQMLFRCEIDEFAKRLRNRWDSDFEDEDLTILSDLVLILKAFDKVFFKKTFESTCSLMNYWHQRRITWNVVYWFINRYRTNYVLKLSF